MKLSKWETSLFFTVLLSKHNECKTFLFANSTIWHKTHSYILDLETVQECLCKLAMKHMTLQGISYWNVKSNLGLTDRNMLVRLCLKVSVWSWVLDIWLSSSNFQKSNIDWPQQPLTEKMPCIGKNLDFWVSIPQKMTIIGHFGAIDDQIIRIGKFFKEVGL